jgi:hypothetical protein
MGAAVVFVATFGSVIFAATQRPDHPAVDVLGQSDFPALDVDLAAHRALLTPESDRPAKPSGGWEAPDSPKRPKPSAPDGRTDDDRKSRVLAFVQTEVALGRSIPRQADIVERFGVPRSTVSDWIGEWEADGLIPARRTVGRCKAIVPA